MPCVAKLQTHRGLVETRWARQWGRAGETSETGDVYGGAEGQQRDQVAVSSFSLMSVSVVLPEPPLEGLDYSPGH